MKKVLILFPDMLFYKIPIFNKLELYLKNHGYEIIIWATSYEDVNNIKSFKHINKIELNITNYLKILKEHDIQYVVNFLFKSKPGYFFYMLSLVITKLKRIPIIFYGHGIDKSVDTTLSNFIYNFFYFLFDGIILYTPNEKQKLWKIFHKKITIAFNTLDMDGKNELVTESKEQLKLKYGIKEKNVILTTGRLQKRKKIHLLLNLFQKYKHVLTDTAWLIIGPEISIDISNEIEKSNNIYYLGPQYEPKKMADFFALSDIYSIPGFMGLGIVEAIYWGLPVVTQVGKHAPELFYVDNNYNGFITKNQNDYEKKILLLLNNNELRESFSKNAKKKYDDFATLDKMFSGFYKQLKRFN